MSVEPNAAVIVVGTFFLMLPGFASIFAALKAGEIVGDKTEGLLTFVGVFGFLWCFVFFVIGIWHLFQL